MKTWKKLLSVVGLAGVVSFQPAQAASEFLFLQLLTADAAGAGSTSIGLWDLQAFPLPGTNSINIAATNINGWNFSGFLSGAVTSSNPLNMKITGSAFRSHGVTGTDNVFCLAIPFALCNRQVAFDLGGGASNERLQVRVGIGHWNSMGAGTLLKDDFRVTSNPVAGTSASTQMDEGGFLQNLGVVNFAGAGGNLVSFPTLLNPNPIFNMVFGFDLISLALQTPTNPIGNQFDFSNTITAVPEPGTLALLGLALVGVAAVRRKKAATV